MKKRSIALLIVFGSLAVLTAVILIGGTRGMDEVRSRVLPPLDLANIDDGTYPGACDIGRWSLEVAVTVTDHRITGARITDKKTANITPELQAILNARFIGRAEPEFDAVTGASITGKAYFIAVADALSHAEQ
jgi:uncharacterized protein with FMN-binding domain